MKTEDMINMLNEINTLNALSRDHLAEEVEKVLMPIPNEVSVQTKTHTVTLACVYSDCRQCSGARIVIGQDDAALVDGKLVRDCDTNFWDGHTWQRRCGPLRLTREPGPSLELATKATLLSLAVELPEALSAWVAEQTEEANALDAATKKFKAAVSGINLA